MKTSERKDSPRKRSSSIFEPKDVELNRMLDVVDGIKDKLRGLQGGNDQAFIKSIESELPRFVVLGAQSSGKSSILRRISSIALPEAKVRTNIHTLLCHMSASDEVD